MSATKLWGIPLLAALAAAPLGAGAPCAGHAESHVAAPETPAAHARGDRASDRGRTAPSDGAREREAALLLMLGDAAAHWRLR